jgi:ELP3 family radical SAM enzyme/protein acetyltransferase
MLSKVLWDEKLDADYYKIYPTAVTPFTKIQEWYHEGKYRPYADEENGAKLIQLLVWFKEHVQEWKRINRIPRDIPNQSIIAGNNKTNLRQLLMQEMLERGVHCRCIRCREVKNLAPDLAAAVLVERSHAASGGREHFISFETPDQSVLLGFLRLRFNEDPERNVFPELQGAALIRELHVYGVIVPTYEDSEAAQRPQHFGLGKRLVARAERVAWAAGVRRVAIISGVGVRRYYEKLGYSLRGVGQYMIKDLSAESVLESADDVTQARSKDDISAAIIGREALEHAALHPGGAGAAGRFGEGRRWRRRNRKEEAQTCASSGVAPCAPE